MYGTQFPFPTTEEMSCANNAPLTFLAMLRTMKTSDFVFLYNLFKNDTVLDIIDVARSMVHMTAEHNERNAVPYTPEKLAEYNEEWRNCLSQEQYDEYLRICDSIEQHILRIKQMEG